MGTCAATLRGHSKEVECVAAENGLKIDSHGALVASGSAEGSIRLWDIRSKTAVKVLVSDGKAPTRMRRRTRWCLWNMRKSKDSLGRGTKLSVLNSLLSFVAILIINCGPHQSASSVRQLQVALKMLFDARFFRSGRTTPVLPFVLLGPLTCNASAYHKGKNTHPAASLYKSPSPRLLQSLHKDRVASLVMRSGVLISGSDDGTVGVVDLRHLKADKSHVMRGHLGPVTAVQINGGNYVASGSTDRTVSEQEAPHRTAVGDPWSPG